MADPREDLRWFHAILTTYGAWLPGDPRGFRTRHHRQHVEGDYKNPPESGLYDGLHRSARRLQSEATVTFPAPLRPLIAEWLATRLRQLDLLFAILAVAGRHAHLLVKLPASQSWNCLAQLKRDVTFHLKSQNWRGRTWGGKGKCIPILNRAHQLNTYSYITDHVNEGAAVVTWKDWLARSSERDAGPGDAVAGLD